MNEKAQDLSQLHPASARWLQEKLDALEGIRELVNHLLELVGVDDVVGLGACKGVGRYVGAVATHRVADARDG